jgi:hypothetical protein
MQAIKEEATYREQMSRAASITGPAPAKMAGVENYQKFESGRNTVTYNTMTNHTRRTSKQQLNSLTFKKTSHFFSQTQKPANLAESWKPNPKLNKHR